jgi:hypothetical protein
MSSSNTEQKKCYIKPSLNQVWLDNEISVFMTSSPEPPGDPTFRFGVEGPDPDMNPFKFIQ